MLKSGLLSHNLYSVAVMYTMQFVPGRGEAQETR